MNFALAFLVGFSAILKDNSGHYFQIWDYGCFQLSQCPRITRYIFISIVRV